VTAQEMSPRALEAVGSISLLVRRMMFATEAEILSQNVLVSIFWIPRLA
jgi:hypothetical protein